MACGCHCLNKHMIARKVYLISDKKSNQWSLICCKTIIISIIVIIIISNAYA